MADECPEIEILAAYIDGKLKAEDRNRVEPHLFDCDSCRKTVALAIKSRLAVPDPTPSDNSDL